MRNGAITVVVVDDHPVVRAGIRAILTATGDLTVVAAGVNGHDALRLAEAVRPNVLILDINLPDANGLEVTRRLRSRGDRTPIVMLTVHSDNQTVLGLPEAGANGYVVKKDAPDRVADAVRAVSSGETWLSPIVAGQAVHRAVVQPPQPAEYSDPPPSPLTPRANWMRSVPAAQLWFSLNTNFPEAEAQVRTLHPDLAVVDVMLPGINGLDGTPRRMGPCAGAAGHFGQRLC